MIRGEMCHTAILKKIGKSQSLFLIQSGKVGFCLCKVLLMEEILHHLGCKSIVNNGINYQPQLVSPISSINSIVFP